MSPQPLILGEHDKQPIKIWLPQNWGRGQIPNPARATPADTLSIPARL